MVSRHQAFNVLDQLKGFKGKGLKTSLTAGKEEELREVRKQT